MRFEIDFEDGIVEKWEPTSLLMGVDDKETLAQMLEFNYQYLKGPVSLREDSEYIASMSLPLVSRIFRESGERSFDPVEMTDSLIFNHFDIGQDSEMYEDPDIEEGVVKQFSRKYVQTLD